MKSIVSKVSEAGYLNITDHMWFEAELHVDISIVIKNTINAIPVLLQMSFTLCQNTTGYWSKRQSKSRMESFVLNGFKTRYHNMTNHVQFGTKSPVVYSKVH